MRQLARQELLLDERRDAELLGQALAIGGLLGLLADQLRDADRGRGLGGERGQQAPVVGRVVLLREARAEVQRADQLPLRDQRHDQGDAGGPQCVHRGRAQLEARDVHGTGGRLEIGQQRVVVGDVDGDGRAVGEPLGARRGGG